MEDSELELRRRIDDLARELLKSGASSSRADAQLRAEEIVKGELRREDHEKGVKAEVTVKQSSDASELIVSNERLLSELNKIKIKMDEYYKEILAIKEAMSEIKTKVGKPTIVEARLEPRERKEAPEQLFKEIKTEPRQEPKPEPQPTQQKRFSPEEGGEVESTVHPRSGSYTPKDVAIDKFFYYGNKPQE